jgi:hypothetical protein
MLGTIEWLHNLWPLASRAVLSYTELVSYLVSWSHEGGKRPTLKYYVYKNTLNNEQFQCTYHVCIFLSEPQLAETL